MSKPIIDLSGMSLHAVDGTETEPLVIAGDLANELSRNGRRSGLTFAPEGGSERLRKVINKMVSEEDLIDTVAAAFKQRLAAGEAVLHVWPAHRDRRGRPPDRGAGGARH